MSDATEPTRDEIERAKRWAGMQTPPVTVRGFHIRYGYGLDNLPEWVRINHGRGLDCP